MKLSHTYCCHFPEGNFHFHYILVVIACFYNPVKFNIKLHYFIMSLYTTCFWWHRNLDGECIAMIRIWKLNIAHISENLFVHKYMNVKTNIINGYYVYNFGPCTQKYVIHSCMVLASQTSVFNPACVEVRVFLSV